MNTTRLEQLRQFLKEDPNDPFNLYALALEYLRLAETDEARRYFELLLKEHADYLPTYYHAAKFYETLDMTDEALRLLKKGMELARTQHQDKTLRELKSYHDELEF